MVVGNYVWSCRCEPRRKKTEFTDNFTADIKQTNLIKASAVLIVGYHIEIQDILQRAQPGSWQNRYETLTEWLATTKGMIIIPLKFTTWRFQKNLSGWLGVILKQEVSFSLNINQLARSCYYQLRQLRVVSRSFSSSAAAALVHAFVTSRLDHCSSILVGLPLALTARLDRVLCCAARLIGRIFGNILLFLLVCVICCIGSQLLTASLIG